jgi:hypothetical protein
MKDLDWIYWDWKRGWHQMRSSVRRLKRFSMMDRKSMATPMTTHLRKLCDGIDICFAESTLCQYMVEP